MATQTGSLDLSAVKQAFIKTVAKAQPIYKRTNANSAPNPPTSKITATTDQGTSGNWTTMHMARLCSTNFAYKYLWTCNQLLAQDGTFLGTTEVVADNGTTVINGDEIATGTIAAERLNIADTITAINNNSTTTINGGKITANTLSVNAVKSDSGTFNTANIPNLSADKITTGTIQIGRIPNGALNSELSSSITNAGMTANSYINDIDSKSGITIKAVNGTTDNNATTGNYLKLNPTEGLNIYKGGVSVAQYGDTARVGKETDRHIDLSTSGFDVAIDEDSYIVEFRYGSTKGESSIGTTPYYIIGRRNTPITYSLATKYGSPKKTLIVYNGIQYISNTEIAEGEAWTSSHWDVANGAYSLVEGRDCFAKGPFSHAEGMYTTASGGGSHAEGYTTIASGHESHAEGYITEASGIYSHAEGCVTIANGPRSHAEGYHAEATGANAHAEGLYSQAVGDHSHAQNYYTVANGYSQTTIGKFNIADTTNALIIGNGASENSRSNALTVDWQGNVEAAGEVTGATSKTVITTFSSGWNVYSTDPSAPVTLRRCGKFVDLTGMIKNTTAVTLNATQVTIFTIPEGYRPSQTMTILSQGSSMNVFVIRIKASGEVTFERYRSTNSTSTSYSRISEGDWFPIHAAWIMD